MSHETSIKRGYFVTGTDTGVGKTFVSCALLRSFSHQGLRAVGMKPVASGCRRENGELISEDVEQLLAAGNVAMPHSAINPYAFEPPLAPHIAAQRIGVKISLAGIVEKYADLCSKADVVVVEGVGGFRVPLGDREDTADLAVALGLPVILVVGMRLGCINHAVLTAESISNAGLHLAGWVANIIDPGMDAVEENIAALLKRIPSPHISTIHFQKMGNGVPSSLMDVGKIL